MVTALSSLFSGRHAKPLVAMTGEVTLTGKVLPIGGVKEKALGAHRAGIKTLIFPEKNKKDVLEEIPDEIRREMKIYFATDVKQVLERTLEPKAGARRTSSVTSGNNPAVKAEPTSKRKKQETPMPLPQVPPKTDIVPNPNAIH